MSSHAKAILWRAEFLSPRKPAEPSREALLVALAERDRELAEARQREEATEEVLEVINSSSADLGAAFDAIVENAMRLCGAACGGLWIVDGDVATRSTRATFRGLTSNS